MLALGLGLALVLAPPGAAAPPDPLQQYLGLAEATLARPITPAELDAAVLSPAGVEDVAALFEASLAGRLVVGGASVTPELGGEATLDGGRLRFVRYPDPLHAVIHRMVELAEDPPALLAFLSASPEGRQVLSGAGGLHALLYQMTTQPVTAAQRRAMDDVLRGAAERYLKTWTVSPETQIENVGRHEWRGRYVGFWHIHPPRPHAGGYGPGIEPSAEDLAIALEQGQLLTLVFQPDGFDAYDLAPVASLGKPDLSAARLVRYRSAAWAGRFQVWGR